MDRVGTWKNKRLDVILNSQPQVFLERYRNTGEKLVSVSFIVQYDIISQIFWLLKSIIIILLFILYVL